MQTAICYFSATGNSFDIANRLSLQVGSDIFFIPNTSAQNLAGYERVIIVSPIYAFGLPIPTKQFIEKLSAISDMKNKKYFVVLNYGGFSSNAVYYTQSFFEKNNLPIQNVYKMKMPESFTIVAMPPKFFISSTLKKSQKSIERIAKLIDSGLTKKHKKNIFSFLDNTHNKVSLSCAKFAKNFIVSSACNSCGYCLQICPSKNIIIENEKPVFSDNCVACLACFQRCPEVAIDFGKRTIGKPRYTNPNVDFSQMH